MTPIEILYLCPELVVCVKPAGILSQAGSNGRANMVSLLEAQLNSTIFPVHRLDREVGGVMVYARTKDAAGALSRQIQQGLVEKEYLAAVRGRPEPVQGQLNDLLFHDRTRNKTYVVDRKRRGVREAKLLYRVLTTDGDHSLVQVHLLTGRTHQIRVQFSSRGYPLLGDGRYGGGNGQVQLWSVSLTLDIPGFGRKRFLSVPEELGGFSPLPAPAPLFFAEK